MIHDATGIHFLERRECLALPFLGNFLRQVCCHDSGGHGVVTHDQAAQEHARVPVEAQPSDSTREPAAVRAPERYNSA